MKKISAIIVVLVVCIALINLGETKQIQISSSLDLEDNNDYSSFRLMDKSIRGKELFLTGESHGVQMNQEVDLKFLKYFYEKADVRYYISEEPYSTAYILNKYLQTNDVKYLELYKDLYGDTYLADEGHLRKWENVAAFNSTVKDSEKIKIYGIDLETNYQVALLAIHFLKQDKEMDQQDLVINDAARLASLVTKREERLKEIYKYVEDQKNDFVVNETLYKNLLKEDYFAVQFIFNNMVDDIEMNKGNSNGVEFNQQRDLEVYRNFVELHEYLPKEKMYGQWGLGHIIQHEVPSNKWMAAYLNEGILKDKILSIAYVYDHCEAEFNGQEVVIDTIMEPLTFIKRSNREEAILHRLEYKDSIFKKTLEWPMNDKDRTQAIGPPLDGVTTDYMQFVVVISKSKLDK